MGVKTVVLPSNKDCIINVIYDDNKVSLTIAGKIPKKPILIKMYHWRKFVANVKSGKFRMIPKKALSIPVKNPVEGIRLCKTIDCEYLELKCIDRDSLQPIYFISLEDWYFLKERIIKQNFFDVD